MNNAAASPLLVADGLTKSFDDKLILEQVSFAVAEGSSTAFVSPSGSGKSTLLALLGLILAPDAGELNLLGTPALALDDTQKAALRNTALGFVFQHTQLIGSLRALENVSMPASFTRHLDFDPLERARELLVCLGLEDKLNHYPHQLSVGQKRRVMTARALILNPRIIIADEPTNDLDRENAELVTDLLFAHAAKGNALLYATHDEALAKRASRIMRLEGHRFV